ncbi:MAG: ATP-binding cassette domain-containing protein, partial [Planctomycetaceae bacterium]|nr:ATP-binding cassette domain-containing protein [Planctomycetaceae bacterium]
AVRLLTRVGLGERLDHRPNQLSGGEQQRVAIVRALLKRPSIVLADEPTGELDTENGAEVFGYLRELCEEQGSTVVVVTHDRTHIREEDHVLHVRDGQIHNPG